MADSEVTKSLAGSLRRAMTLPEIRMPEIRVPEIPPNPLIVASGANYASEFHKRLVKWISNFDASLDQEHEVGVRLVSFGQTVVFRLNGIGFWNPSLLCFKGVTDDGSPVELIQHVSQISVLLMKLRRKDTSKPKRKIGFISETDGEIEESNVP